MNLREQVDGWVRHLRRQGPVVLLESQSTEHPAACKTYLAGCPVATIRARGQQVVVREQGQRSSAKADPWQALSNFRVERDGWLFGYLGYDLKNSIEDLCSRNPDVLEAPDLFFMEAGLVAEVDYERERVQVYRGELPDLSDAPSLDTGRAEAPGGIASTVSRNEYIRIIEQAQQDIYEGTYYEVNLSHQLQGQFRGDPFELYRRMRAYGPVPFGAYLQLGSLAVCSQSPERFLKKSGATVASQPIKGTIERGTGEAEDQRLRQRLIESVKDQAENLMIVDLVRNDLSRIAGAGSVEVSDLFEIQTFGTVHQMVSTVKAQTAVDDPVAVLRACYPMGSMTGAPKISAMQAIEELENYRRGIYSGAIGYLTPGGDFDFSVVIRTALIRGNQLCYGVGGAVTSDSDPADEWDETWVKARALLDIL